MKREELLQWASRQTGLPLVQIVVRNPVTGEVLAAGDNNAFRRPLSLQDQKRRRRAAANAARKARKGRRA